MKWRLILSNSKTMKSITVDIDEMLIKDNALKELQRELNNIYQILKEDE